MKALVYCNTTDKSIGTGSGAWSPPPLTFGETLSLAVRFQEAINGNATEIFPSVHYVKAALGNLDARPLAGKFCLKIGDAAQSNDNTTAPLDWNAGPASIKQAINSLTAITTAFGLVEVAGSDGSFVFRFGDGEENVSIALVNSTLEPSSLGLTSAYQVAGKWVSELRLVQAPAAFTDSSERVLPGAPVVTEIQGGGSSDGGDYKWNEIQQLYMPPDFRGTYQFRFNGVRSALLSREDGTDAVATALAKFGSGIVVTLPRDGVMRIEFGGDMAGTPYPLLEIIVADAPDGDLTLSLNLDRPALAAMLRAQPSVTLPLEIEIGIGDDSVLGGVRKDKFRTTATIQRGLIFGLLATSLGIDWLRPVAKSYIPFTMDQIFRGQLYYAAPLGNGEALEFVIDHELHSDAIASVLVRENVGDGRVLVLGVDYVVTYGGSDSLTITLVPGTTPPATGGLLAVLTAAGMRDSFLAHTHTTEQVVGLDARFESLESRVHVLEEFIPGHPPTVSTQGSALKIIIPARAEVLFYPAVKPDPAKLPSVAPMLLPAVHTTTTTALPDTLPAPATNSVWSVATRTLIPGSSGRIPASYVDAGGFVASDGRLLFPASRAGTTNSYYPQSFERTLFEFPINAEQFQVNRVLDVQFAVAARVINASCECQWVAVVEWGLPVDQSDPENEGLNLEAIAWNATPILTQRIYLTPLLMTHPFGCRIRRNADALTADKMFYQSWQSAGNAPSSPNFVLRARLVQFDTRNNVPNANGWLYYGLVKSDNTEGDITVTLS